MEAAINTLVQRLETVTARLETVEKQLASGGPAPAASSSASEGGSALYVQEYEDLINQYITPYVELSKKIAPEVAQQAELVLKAVHAQRDFLKVASTSKKPADAVLQKAIKPTSDLMGQIVEVRDKNRSSKFPNHLATISEGIAALGWVVIDKTPGPHIGDMRGGSEFYSNRILKDFKGKDQTQVDWATSYNTFLKELQNYVKKHHTTGTAWNARGGDAEAALKAVSSGSSAPAQSDDVPPPPTGAPPAPTAPTPTQSSSGGSGPDMNAIFASINKGEGVTSGLKKVTNDMKTKNRTDKVSVVPAAAVKTSSGPAEKKAAAPAKPSKLSLDGNKWSVEYFVGNKQIVISETEVRHTVYIYKCKDSVIQIKGKVNAVTLDDCTKTAVVFENIVAAFEIVNCNSVEVQAVGKVPAIAIDKTSGCQVYLSKESIDVEIVTSKSSEMNISFPDNTGELTESPVPEQYKSQVKNGKLVTEIVQHV